MTETTNSLARGLRVISCLRGSALSGKSHKEVTQATNLSAATVTRILATLIDEGFAIQLDNGRYALSVRVLQIAQAHANEISRAQGRIDELQQRVHAGAHQ